MSQNSGSQIVGAASKPRVVGGGEFHANGAEGGEGFWRYRAGVFVWQGRTTGWTSPGRMQDLWSWVSAVSYALSWDCPCYTQLLGLPPAKYLVGI